MSPKCPKWNQNDHFWWVLKTARWQIHILENYGYWRLIPWLHIFTCLPKLINFHKQIKIDCCNQAGDVTFSGSSHLVIIFSTLQSFCGYLLRHMWARIKIVDRHRFSPSRVWKKMNSSVKIFKRPWSSSCVIRKRTWK